MDATRSGRPVTSTTDAVVVAVEKLIMQDRRITVNEITAAMGISHGTAHTILHEKLNMNKVSARWVPRQLTLQHKNNRLDMCASLLTRQGQDTNFISKIVTMDESWFPLFNPETKRQSAQWKHLTSPPPQKFRVQPSNEKIMYAIFWDCRGIILAHPVPKGTTVTGTSYVDTLATKFLPAMREKRPELLVEGFCFHQDNAPPHRSHLVRQFFIDNDIELLMHAPYSPDLAPSDFWLFPNVKDPLRGKKFSSRAALGSAIYQWSLHTSTDQFAGAFTAWIERWKKCIEREGDYIEK